MIENRGSLPSLLLRFVELLLFGLVFVSYQKVCVAAANVNTRQPKQLLQRFFRIFVCILFPAATFLSLTVRPPKGLTSLAGVLYSLLEAE